MRESYKEEVSYEGIYWWSDAGNVIDPLLEKLKEIANETQISTIKITGVDFNDGRQIREVTIRVNQSNHKIEIQKEYF